MPGTELCNQWEREINERLEAPEGERKMHVRFMFLLCLCYIYVLFIIKPYVYIQLVPVSSLLIFKVCYKGDKTWEVEGACCRRDLGAVGGSRR